MDTVRWIFFHLILCLIIHNGRALFRGSRALRGQFPYMAAVMKPGCLICSGSIISRKHILTAAHCFNCFTQKHIFILVGQASIADESHSLAVETIHRHPKYYPDTEPTALICLKMICSCFMEPPKIPRPKYDIAIVTLTEPLDFTDYARPVDLPTSLGLDFCDYCVFTGWGKSSKHETFSKILRWALFEILEPRECARRHQPLSPDGGELCAIDKDQEATPGGGDSGGPLVCEDMVVGVLSMSHDRPDYASLFVHVYAHMDFIDGVVYSRNN